MSCRRSPTGCARACASPTPSPASAATSSRSSCRSRRRRPRALVAQTLCAEIEKPFVTDDGLELRVRGSIGVAIAPHDGEDTETLVRRADSAMYRAKAAGGGETLYAPEVDDAPPERLLMVAELRAALEQRELVMHFQPKISLATGRIEGLEALIRWPHPRLGLLMPDRFLELTERAGLMSSLTSFAIDAALRECRSWLAAGLEVKVAVNLSPESLRDDRIVEEVEQLLAERDVPGRLLQLEITENCLVADPETAGRVLGRLRALGRRHRDRRLRHRLLVAGPHQGPADRRDQDRPQLRRRPGRRHDGGGDRPLDDPARARPRPARRGRGRRDERRARPTRRASAATRSRATCWAARCRATSCGRRSPRPSTRRCTPPEQRVLSAFSQPRPLEAPDASLRAPRRGDASRGRRHPRLPRRPDPAPAGRPPVCCARPSRGSSPPRSPGWRLPASPACSSGDRRRRCCAASRSAWGPRTSGSASG